jgi:cell division protein FtsB
MLDFYQKRRLRSIANSRLSQAGLVVVFGFLAMNAFERYTVTATMGDRRSAVEQTAATLEARKDALEAEVRYLQDERGIEAEMRRQFDVALPGEEVVVILEEELPPEILPLATTTEKRRWWQWW